MTFNTNDDRLTAYALGELDEASRTEFESELSNSPELQQELTELQGLAGMLRSEFSMEANPSLTTEQHTAVLAQAAKSNQVTKAQLAVPQQPRHQRWVLLGPCVAAAMAIAVVVTNSKRESVPKDTDSLVQYSAPTDPVGTLSQVQLIQEYNDLYKQERFVEAEVLSKKYREAKPKDAAAEALFWKARVARRKAMNDQLAESEGEAFMKQLDDVESLAVVVRAGDSNPLVYGDNWADISKRREMHGHVSGRKPTPEEAKIQEQLKKRVSLHVEEARLGDVIKDLEKAADVSINFDTVGLKEAAVTTDDMVTIDVDGIQAKSVLNLVLGRHDLAYLVDGAGVKITSRARQQSELPALLTVDESHEAYEPLVENTFLTPIQQPLSTFSIDVDSASYSNVRRFLTAGQRPPADAVRLEEMVNYFNYSYPQPKDGEPFSVTADAAACPWQSKNYLARIGLQARTIEKAKRPPTNLVFLLDVSGSMQAANKLPLVKQAMTMLTEELNDRDRIAIVTYAGDAGVKLASTVGSDQTRIMQSIEALQAGGSTNGAAGINLAYEEAVRHFNGEGENRVILCTDGDFNVGVSSDDELVQLIQQQAKSKVFLSIFGFGMGNLKDAKLEKLADKGNGHYGYIDDLKEARRVFNEELVGTLYTVAKDVKIQVEFNPLTVGAYRLIGYENRMLAAKDFNDDTKDAGEIGAGHTVTALYEIVPKSQWSKAQPVDPLKYTGTPKEPAPAAETTPKANLPVESADDLFTVKLRYKQPTADTSVKTIDYVVDDIADKKIVPTADFVWAASVASFGMQLRNSQFKGNWTLNDVYEAAQGAKGPDANGRRREFLDLVQAAKRLAVEGKQ